jgi:hypothetical protein
MTEDKIRAEAVLEELDGLAEAWAVANHMSHTAQRVANAPPAKRAEGILALLELAYAEGYYHAAIARPDTIPATLT